MRTARRRRLYSLPNTVHCQELSPMMVLNTRMGECGRQGVIKQCQVFSSTLPYYLHNILTSLFLFMASGRKGANADWYLARTLNLDHQGLFECVGDPLLLSLSSGSTAAVLTVASAQTVLVDLQVPKVSESQRS